MSHDVIAYETRIAMSDCQAAVHCEADGKWGDAAYCWIMAADRIDYLIRSSHFAANIARICAGCLWNAANCIERHYQEETK